MYLEIVSPEALLLRAEVDSVSVPGINGQFQMLNNHAPIVSVLKKGQIKIFANSGDIKPEGKTSLFQRDPANNKILIFAVDGGVVEMKNNKIIVLAD